MDKLHTALGKMPPGLYIECLRERQKYEAEVAQCSGCMVSRKLDGKSRSVCPGHEKDADELIKKWNIKSFIHGEHGTCVIS